MEAPEKKSNVYIFSPFKNNLEIPKKDMKDPGYVYIADNKSFIDQYLKIGLTRLSPQRRIAQLTSATSSPGHFILRCVFESDDCKTLESDIHSLFREYRVSKNKEFFNIPWFAAMIEINRNMDFYQTDIYSTWMFSKLNKGLSEAFERFAHSYN